MSRQQHDNPGDKHGSGQQAGHDHGNTPAAWTAVVVGLAGFVVGGIGLMIGSMTTFWIGVVLAPLALVVLGVMNKMGYGNAGETRH
jgi:hypothetical protein